MDDPILNEWTCSSCQKSTSMMGQGHWSSMKKRGLQQFSSQKYLDLSGCTSFNIIDFPRKYMLLSFEVGNTTYTFRITQYLVGYMDVGILKRCLSFKITNSYKRSNPMCHVRSTECVLYVIWMNYDKTKQQAGLRWVYTKYIN